MNLKKLVLTGGLLLSTASAVFFTTQAYATDSEWTITASYSDATFTQKVGSTRKDCLGRLTNSGTITVYKKEILREPCCGTQFC